MGIFWTFMSLPTIAPADDFTAGALDGAEAAS
jgi:hypothetical protein